MKHDGSIALFQYWNSLRGERVAPARAVVVPADIRSLLADTFILEKGSRGEAVFRLAGIRLCAIYGRELRGCSFASLWKEEDRRLITHLADSVFASKSVVVIAFRGVSRSGRETALELLLLPLDGGLPNPRCMGIISAGLKPFWLGADPITEAKVDEVLAFDPDRESASGNGSAVTIPPLAPTASTFGSEESGLSRGRRIHPLIVIDGGSQRQF